MELFFLGCGGGRIITDRQLLATGGFRVHAKEVMMHVDPGPGALVKTFQHKLDPVHLNAIFVSHAHVDHCNDAGVLVEAMNFGHFNKKKGTLVAAASVLQGTQGFEKQVDDYFLNMLEKRVPLKAGETVSLSSHAKLTATKTKHEDPTAIGFKLKADGITLGYTADTAVFEGFQEQWEACDFLVINCLRPFNDKFPFHLCVEEVTAMLNSLAEKPKAVFLSHAGKKMVDAGREAQRKSVEEKTGIRTFNVEEGLHMGLQELASKQKKLE